MRTLLVSALALGALTSTAFAEPLALSDVQMEGITAGSQSNNISVSLTAEQSNSAKVIDNDFSEVEVTQTNVANVSIDATQLNLR